MQKSLFCRKRKVKKISFHQKTKGNDVEVEGSRSLYFYDIYNYFDLESLLLRNFSSVFPRDDDDDEKKRVKRFY